MGRLFSIMSVSFLSAIALCSCGRKENPSSSEKTCPEEEHYIEITDRQNQEIKQLNLPFSSYSAVIVIRADGEWNIDVPDSVSWLSVKSISAATASISVQVNTTRCARTTSICVASKDGKVVKCLPVCQDFGETIGSAEIHDLILIYDGDDEGLGTVAKSRWTREKFRKYVASPGRNPRWLFDGFLFLGLKYDGRSFVNDGVTAPSNQGDWSGMLDYLLSPLHSLSALDDAIGEMKDSVKQVFVKRKVVIFMPDPQYGQANWGEIDGDSMDFGNYADRVRACKWYVDRLLDKFAEKKFQNIQLAGIYWICENGSFLPEYMKQVSDYVHSKNLKAYWIPYYQAFGYQDWKKYGFDHAYYQPNYCFDDTVPKSRLYDACAQAKAASMDMEVEFDSYSDLDRNSDYIDVYGELGILDSQDLAYYADYSIESWYSGKKEEYDFYLRLCDIIAERQTQYCK